MIRDSPIGVLLSRANEEQLFYLRKVVSEADNETRILMNGASGIKQDVDSELNKVRGKMRSYFEKLESLDIGKIDKYNLVSRMNIEYSQYSAMEIPQYSKDRN